MDTLKFLEDKLANLQQIRDDAEEAKILNEDFKPSKAEEIQIKQSIDELPEQVEEEMAKTIRQAEKIVALRKKKEAEAKRQKK